MTKKDNKRPRPVIDGGQKLLVFTITKQELEYLSVHLKKRLDFLQKTYSMALQSGNLYEHFATECGVDKLQELKDEIKLLRVLTPMIDYRLDYPEEFESEGESDHGA